MRIGLPTTIVELHHGLQAGEAAVVHVRCCLGNLTQSRRLESATIFDDARHCSAAFVGKTPPIPPDTEIMENAVAEVVALMAKAAVSFAFEQLHAFNGFLA
jgi:hypothetical protein